MGYRQYRLVVGLIMAIADRQIEQLYQLVSNQTLLAAACGNASKLVQLPRKLDSSDPKQDGKNTKHTHSSSDAKKEHNGASNCIHSTKRDLYAYVFS